MKYNEAHQQRQSANEEHDPFGKLILEISAAWPTEFFQQIVASDSSICSLLYPQPILEAGMS